MRWLVLSLSHIRGTALGNQMRIWLFVILVVAVAGCDSRKQSAPTQRAATRPAAKGEDAFKVLTARDAATETDFRVSDDGRVLTATDKDGHVLWAVDVIEKAGAPFVGEPTI